MTHPQTCTKHPTEKERPLSNRPVHFYHITFHSLILQIPATPTQTNQTMISKSSFTFFEIFETIFYFGKSKGKLQSDQKLITLNLQIFQIEVLL